MFCYARRHRRSHRQQQQSTTAMTTMTTEMRPSYTGVHVLCPCPCPSFVISFYGVWVQHEETQCFPLHFLANTLDNDDSCGCPWLCVVRESLPTAWRCRMPFPKMLCVVQAVSLSFLSTSMKRNEISHFQGNETCAWCAWLSRCLFARVSRSRHSIFEQRNEWNCANVIRHSFAKTGRDWVPNRIKIFRFSVSILCAAFSAIQLRMALMAWYSAWMWAAVLAEWMSQLFGSSRSMTLIHNVNTTYIRYECMIIHVLSRMWTRINSDGVFSAAFNSTRCYFIFANGHFFSISLMIRLFLALVNGHCPFPTFNEAIGSNWSRVDRHSTPNKKRSVKRWHLWVDVASTRWSNTLQYSTVYNLHNTTCEFAM